MKSFRNYLESTLTKKDVKIDNITTQALSPTGFMYLDYMNGINTIVYDEHERPIECFHNVGYLNGSVNTFIAKSGLGKTAITLTMARGIIEPWIKDPILRKYLAPDVNPEFDFDEKNSLIHIVDTEGTLEINNVKRVTQYPNKLLKKHIEINQITSDKELILCLERHIKYKIDTMKKVYLPMRDIYGNFIYTYPPTVFIVDSISKLNMKDTEGTENYDKGINNTAGARRAKIISQVYSLLSDVAKKYNIIVFSVSHINVKPNMGFLPTPKQYRGLKQDETLGGGEKAIYLASNITRMDLIKSIGGESSSALNFGEDIEGFLTKGSHIKSKTNAFGHYTNLVYLNKCGYDPFVSTLYEAMMNGDLQASGNNYILDKYPDIKFNIRTYKEVFQDNYELIAAFYDQIKYKASRFLSSVEDFGKDSANFNKELLKAPDANLDYSSMTESDINELDDIYDTIYKNIA